jgi:hypothetical protein
MNKNDKRKFLMLIRIASALAGVVWVSSVLTVDIHWEKKGKTEITPK